MTLSLSKFKKQLTKVDFTQAQIDEAIDRFVAQAEGRYTRDQVAREISGFITAIEAPASTLGELQRHAGYAVALGQTPATPKQIAYLARLMDDDFERVEDHLSVNQPLTVKMASFMIDRLK